MAFLSETQLNKTRISTLLNSGYSDCFDSNQIKSTNLVYWVKCLKYYLLGKSVNATDLLALVHSEANGPMSSYAIGGYEYFMTFTDVASRYDYVYLMKHK